MQSVRLVGSAGRVRGAWDQVRAVMLKGILSDRRTQAVPSHLHHHSRLNSNFHRHQHYHKIAPHSCCLFSSPTYYALSAELSCFHGCVGRGYFYCCRTWSSQDAVWFLPPHCFFLQLWSLYDLMCHFCALSRPVSDALASTAIWYQMMVRRRLTVWTGLDSMECQTLDELNVMVFWLINSSMCYSSM